MTRSQTVRDRLRRRGARDKCPGREELEDEIAQIQRKARCAQRAGGLMALLTALAAAGLVYPAVLLENYSSIAPRFIMNFTYALGAGSVISLIAFAGLASLYRKKLRLRKHECRQRVAGLFDSALSQSDTTTFGTLPANTVGARNDGIL
jgi:hypothetical protein